MLFRLAKALRVYQMNCRSFSFGSYNCIGFDLDHTICLYQLDNVVQLQFNLLVKYLVNNGYDPDIFPKKLSNDDVDFIQRGLCLDFKKGNILKINHDGTIVCGTHGTRKLNKKEITSIYGEKNKWDLTDRFLRDIRASWNSPISDSMRFMMEFFDCQVPLIFGKMVDFVDEQAGSSSDEYSIWPMILDGIIAMFETGGGFYEALNEKPELYLRKCSNRVTEWMKLLKKSKLIFLLTCSREKEATFLAEYCLGADWKKHFDIIVYHAKKPGFFSSNRPFIERDIDITHTPLELTQGNWNHLNLLISKKTSLEKPKCVYIGDHLIQDVHATSFSTDIDAVALVEEISEEDIFTVEQIEKHPYSDYLKSKFWGSYLFNEDGKTLTIWGDLMKKYSKLHIPDLQYLANNSIDHYYEVTL